MLKRFLRMGFWAALFALIFNIFSQTLLAKVDLVSAFILVLAVVAIGIFFDLIGTAAAAAVETPFHSMASSRVPGAKTAVWLVRNADKVTNICNDLIGDICGTLSGAMTAVIVFRLLLIQPSLPETILSTLLVSLVSALTIGGKAAWKKVGLDYSQEIILNTAKVIRFIYRKELGSKKR
ncbi:MAG: hypothetical protein GX058_07170 [Firmicutes bacterium]|nr:hypothetical protein [Bacillota bacterium]